VKHAPIPGNEAERLASLKKLNLLDTPIEERFERITKFACRLFNVPISTISLIDTNREWFKSCQGTSTREGGRDISFCGHAVIQDDLLIIHDTHLDERFKDNPMVTSAPFIRFYAGQSLRGPGGHKIGVFCLKDQKSRTLTEMEIHNLKDLAAWVELELNSQQLNALVEERDLALQTLQQRHVELEKINKIMVNRELRMIELKKEINDLSGILGRGICYQV
jgi:GAF domain-containing protein